MTMGECGQIGLFFPKNLYESRFQVEGRASILGFNIRETPRARQVLS